MNFFGLTEGTESVVTEYVRPTMSAVASTFGGAQTVVGAVYVAAGVSDLAKHVLDSVIGYRVGLTERPSYLSIGGKPTATNIPLTVLVAQDFQNVYKGGALLLTGKIADDVADLIAGRKTPEWLTDIITRVWEKLPRIGE